MNCDFSYLNFIERHHPQYYSDDRVLLCDILFRYLSDEDVSPEDLVWLQQDYNSKCEVLQELKRLEKLLFSEALENYYERMNLPT